MKRNKTSFLLLLGFIIISSCTSPKEFLEMGNYYDASVKSIQKLNSRLSGKQEQILAESYPKTVQSIRNDIQRINETPTFNRWFLLEQEYRKVNTLNDMVNSSRVGLKIDRQLLTDLQRSTTEVSYEADHSSSEAYKSFLSTYALARAKYLEFLGQPNAKSELHVAYEEINDTDSSYDLFQPQILNRLDRLRLKIETNDLSRSDQLIEVSFEGFKSDSTIITQVSFGSANASTTNMGVPNSVNDAPPEANFGRNYQPGSDFSFRYTITIKCSATITISDSKTKFTLLRKSIEAKDAWVSQWYKYRSNYNNSLASMSPKTIQWRYKSGSQGLNEYDFLARRYFYAELHHGSNQNLEKKIIAELASFYEYYLRED